MCVERGWTNQLWTRRAGRLSRHRRSLCTPVTIILCLRTIGVQTQLTHGKPVDLPSPSASVNNPASVVPPPLGFAPRVPQGFAVSILARDFEDPRWLAVAPNGDVFVAESASGRLVVLHDPLHRPERDVFAEHLLLPFGIAFHQRFVYVAEGNRVDRFPYDPGTSRPTGPPQHVVDLPPVVEPKTPGIYGHSTRSLAFTADGRRMFVSIGTSTNMSLEDDLSRAVIIVCDPDGANRRIYARGLRNAIGIAVIPHSGKLWATVNERGGLGDDVPPDYLTEVRDRGFYGFPYTYVGTHVDARVTARRPESAANVVVPDVLLGPHVAPMQFVFYEASQFPRAFWHGAFIAEHGSSNRSRKVGYDVVFVPFREGRPAAAATPFLDGFVPDPGKAEVYGRPVGVAVATDGSLLVADDGGKKIWRISYRH